VLGDALIQPGGVLRQRLVERPHSDPLFEQFLSQRFVEQARVGQRHRFQQTRAHGEDVEDGRDQHGHERAERQNGQGLYGAHQHAPLSGYGCPCYTVSGRVRGRGPAERGVFQSVQRARQVEPRM